MKTLLSICICAITLISISCNDSGTIPEPSQQTTTLGNMLLRFAAAPEGIATVVAKLSRMGYADRTLSLTVTDSNASGSFNEVPVGAWHLRVDAKDSAGVVRYSGETEVDVHPGATSHVSLQLMPTAGSILIVVTWGNPVQDPSLLLYYPFNGNTNDESGHNNHGIVSGATLVPDRNGNPNRTYSFDGLYNHITIPDLVPDTIASLTIAAWMKPTDLSRRRLGIYLGARTGEIWLQVLNSAFSFGTNLANNTSQEVHPPFSAVNGSYAHVVGVYRRGVSMQIWINGVLGGQISIPFSRLNSGYPTHDGSVGSYAPDWIDAGIIMGFSSWQGALDQVRIYSRALSQSEIFELYNSGQ